MFWKKRKLLIVWLLMLAVPFLSAVILAISVSAKHGSRKLQPSWTTAVSNFRAVLLGGDTDYEFAVCFITSTVLCLTSALITVAVALPIARTLGTRWRKHLWAATGVVIGARVVPVTASIPVFEYLGQLLNLSGSWLFVTALYTLLLLCQRIVIMKDGGVLADSSAEAILSAPPNIDSARLIGGFAMNVIDAELTHEGGVQVLLNTFLGRYCGYVEYDGIRSEIPIKAKAVFRWTEIIGQPISGDSSSESAVFTVGDDGISSLNNPVLYMHDRLTVYGRPRPLSTSARKATLGLAAESALLYDSETENLVGRFIFSSPQTSGSS